MTGAFSFFYTLVPTLEAEKNKYTDLQGGGGGAGKSGRKRDRGVERAEGGESWLGKRKVFSVLTVDKERV
jgi:hypothetical protein